MATLPISTFVDVTTRISSGGVLRTSFGTGLLITLDDALPAGGAFKAQLFRDIEGVEAVFDAGDAIDAATVWFSQAGAKSLYIGRWAPADIETRIVGGEHSPIGDLAFANASWSLNGHDYVADLDGQTTFSAIATRMSTVMAGRGVGEVMITAPGTGYDDNSTVTFAAPPAGGITATGELVLGNSGVVTGVTITNPGSGYTTAPGITIATTGSGASATAVLGDPPDPALSGSAFTYATDHFELRLTGSQDIGLFGPHSTGDGQDISFDAGLSAAGGATNLVGHVAETVTDSVGEMLALAQGATPVALMLAGDAPLEYTVADEDYDTREQLAAFAQAGDYVFGLRETSDQALVANDATSHAALAFSRQQDHVEPIYTKAGELPDIALLALMSSQNLNNPASIITPHLKVLPGVETTTITEAQRAELERKRTNVYTLVGGLPSLVGGFTGRAGSWLDAVWWLLWLKNELELEIFNAQRASRRFNTAILGDTIAAVMRTAVQSGGAQPGGRVSDSIKQDIIATTGNYEFDGILAAGHLTWIEQPSARSQVDRESRIGRFKTWIAPADAVHKVLGTVVLSG